MVTMRVITIAKQNSRCANREGCLCKVNPDLNGK